MIAADGPDAG